MATTKTAVIFGGTGFIGLHFSRFLLDNTDFKRIILADIKPPEKHIASKFVAADIKAGKICYVHSDVRERINLDNIITKGEVAFIANFAAVHREPGHPPHEYFNTNIPGARNVCAFAEKIGCDDILFTSSISPYGPSEIPKTEANIPTPETAYGSSKLAAELIHDAWRCRGITARRLLVVRPGVVFGPGEGGNVSRLVAALTKGFFVYAGNKDTRKAGIYVKELCHAMWWMHEQVQLETPALHTANMTMNPGPSMQEYVEAIEKVNGKKAFVPSIPVWLLMLAAHTIQTLAGPLGLLKSVNAVRVRKIIRSNNILPGTLTSRHYKYVYTLEKALQDWLKDMPSEWRR